MTLFASAIVVATGVFWGLYWLPVRALAGLGLAGPWGTAAITLAAALVLAPAALMRGALAAADRVALASIALGGAAFALYSIGFVYGRVAIIILLWFLSPVWSTLIGRYLMGWRVPGLRLLAMVSGLAGLALMLGGGGGVPVPRGLGEWMSLIGGVLWSFSTTGIRVRMGLDPLSSAFVFALGAVAASLPMAALLAPLPVGSALDWSETALLALLTGGLWWGVSLAGLMWAAMRLEPARVSILLMSEVLVGAASAAVLAGEWLRPLELVGGALVLAAGMLEVVEMRRNG